ncbi:sensor histidine kinase [Roseisolibacter agri]|uniref:sensor histidine kinase n=1 Tax=Roseisolibacter agri TaxID=2014610 RepID=UPI0024E0ACB8|nr:sensor histidine kinase [Roseisolibacter agri]
MRAARASAVTLAIVPAVEATCDDALDFLSGGGAMGACVRAHDWAATSLGSPERWPQPLRQAVRSLFAALQPAALAWGTEPLHLCNDAFARLLAVDGRADLIGASSREKWPLLHDPALGPRLAAVRQDGQPTVVEDHLSCVARNGRVEEAYVSCRLEPVADGAGGVGGVLLVLTETTDRVLSARRTEVLRALAAEAARVRSVEDAHARSMAELARHPADVPFALLYAPDAAGGEAHLVGAAGLAAGGPASPERVALTLTAPAPGWPIAAALARDETLTVDDVATRFGALPGGDWPFAPRVALAIPLAPPGCERPEAVLVVGVSARRALDPGYRSFLELVAGQVAAAIAAGRAYEERRRRADAAAAAGKRARARQRARARAMEARFAGVLEERTRMAREIHDTLLQGVTGIALQLRATLPHVRRSPEGAAEVLERMMALAEATSRDARRAVWDLRGPVAGEGGLPRALLDMARRAAGGAGPAVESAVQGTPRALPRLVHDAIYHVAQEAVANAVRHAAARRIELRLRYARGAVHLTVADDGQGFEFDAGFRSYAGHWGLIGMRERADRIGATLTVASARGEGTTIALRVPCAGRRVASEPGDALSRRGG